MTDPAHSKSRRAFVGKSLLGGGLIMGAPSILSAEARDSPSDAIRVAVVGCGLQWGVLYDAMVNLPGLRFVGACDISENRLRITRGRIRSRYGYLINGYADVEEMFAQEAAIDAVIVATPDFWHAPHAVMAMEAGCHVYCETMMSNTLEGAQSILAAAEKSGKLCQVGYQRRSNPYYRYTLEQLLQRHSFLGDIMRVEAQWFRHKWSFMDRNPNPRFNPDEDILKQYGFKNSFEFANWHLVPRLSAGLTSQLSSHQIDVFNWYLGRTPQKVYAAGTRGYYVERESFDTINTLLDYLMPSGGILQAVHRVSGTSVLSGQYFEAFTGPKGITTMSERRIFQSIFRACGIGPDAWDDLVKRGFLKYDAEAFGEVPSDPYATDAICHESFRRRGNPHYQLPGEVNRPPHMDHLENFFEAIRGKAELNCDAQTAFATERVLHAITQSTQQETAVVL